MDSSNVVIIRTPIYHMPVVGAYITDNGNDIILQIKRQEKHHHSVNHGTFTDEVSLRHFVDTVTAQAASSPAFFYTDPHRIILAEYWRTETRIMLRFKRHGYKKHEDIELWTFVRLILNSTNRHKAA